MDLKKKFNSSSTTIGKINLNFSFSRKSAEKKISHLGEKKNVDRRPSEKKKFWSEALSQKKKFVRKNPDHAPPQMINGRPLNTVVVAFLFLYQNWYWSEPVVALKVPVVLVNGWENIPYTADILQARCGPVQEWWWWTHKDHPSELKLALCVWSTERKKETRKKQTQWKLKGRALHWPN